jgi:hypothetical protein
VRTQGNAHLIAPPAQRKRRSRGAAQVLGAAGTHSTVETDSGGGGDPMRLRGTSRRRRRRRWLRLITDQHCSGGRGLRNLFFGFIQTLGSVLAVRLVFVELQLDLRDQPTRDCGLRVRPPSTARRGQGRKKKDMANN